MLWIFKAKIKKINLQCKEIDRLTNETAKKMLAVKTNSIKKRDKLLIWLIK